MCSDEHDAAAGERKRKCYERRRKNDQNCISDGSVEIRCEDRDLEEDENSKYENSNFRWNVRLWEASTVTAHLQ